MGISGAFALYFIVWWLTLFAMLPIGVRSQHEGDTSQDEVVEGADPGAPRRPMMGKKLIWTTLAAIPVTALLFAWLTMMD